MTIAQQVFAKATTKNIGTIAREHGGKRMPEGYGFPDGSVVRVDALSIGYCASDTWDINSPSR